MDNNVTYIDFGVAPYALPDVCEALFNNGITNAFLTEEDDEIHVRWKYDINRGVKPLVVGKGQLSVSDKGLTLTDNK